MITLQNPGLLEIDFIKTMGVNVKDDEFSIGTFGTGLKYAIAVFLREDVKFQLFIGRNEFEFYTEEKTLRGKDFRFCYMKSPHDSTPLGFTTELGKNWDLWQAYREIHSNCLDENGEIVEGSMGLSDDTTTFIFDNIEKQVNISEIFINWDLPKLLYSSEEIEIYEGESDFIYYQGIKAKTIYPISKYTYNIKKECYLTEDRLLCFDSDVKRVINKSVLELAETNIEVMENIITSTNDCFEAELGMEYHCTSTPSVTFKEAVKEVQKSNKSINYSVTKYIDKHEPVKELTRDQKITNFIDELECLCEEYEIKWDRSDTLESVSFEVYGGILDNEGKE